MRAGLARSFRTPRKCNAGIGFRERAKLAATKAASGKRSNGGSRSLALTRRLKISREKAVALFSH
jgi:hypothetical protein